MQNLGKRQKRIISALYEAPLTIEDCSSVLELQSNNYSLIRDILGNLQDKGIVSFDGEKAELSELGIALYLSFENAEETSQAPSRKNFTFDLLKRKVKV